MASRLEKVKKIFHRFDANGDGGLDRQEMTALFNAVNPGVALTEEQIDAVMDEVSLTYGGLIGRDDRLITLDVLLRSYDDGAGDLDHDFDALGLSLDDEGHPPLRAASSTAADAVWPASVAQLPTLPPRPRRRTTWRLAGELESLIRRLRRQRMKESDKLKAGKRGDHGKQSYFSLGVPSSRETQGTGEAHPAGVPAVSSGSDCGDDGVGASPSPSVAWDRQHSRASSLTSSSFCSEIEGYPDLDNRNRPIQSEYEEIPSFRWLSPSLTPEPAATHLRKPEEINWKKLLYSDTPRIIDDLDTGNDWLTLGLDVRSGKKCGVLEARGLKITWRDNRSSWRYDGDVAVLREVCWLDIHAQVGASNFSPGMAYICLLVFKLSAGAFGLGLSRETQQASVSVGGLVSARTVRLQPASDGRGPDGALEPRRRDDGWMEIELGEFFVEEHRGVNGTVAMNLREVDRLTQLKGGLTVRGIEVRPEQFSTNQLVRLSPRQRRSLFVD